METITKPPSAAAASSAATTRGGRRTSAAIQQAATAEVQEKTLDVAALVIERDQTACEECWFIKVVLFPKLTWKEFVDKIGTDVVVQGRVADARRIKRGAAKCFDEAEVTHGRVTAVDVQRPFMILNEKELAKEVELKKIPKKNLDLLPKSAWPKEDGSGEFEVIYWFPDISKFRKATVRQTVYVSSDTTIMNPSSQVSPFQADEQFWQMVSNKIQTQCADTINRQQNCPGGHPLMTLTDFKMKANPDAVPARAPPWNCPGSSRSKQYPPVPVMDPARPAGGPVIEVGDETQFADTEMDDDTVPEAVDGGSSGAAGAAADDWDLLSARGGSPKRSLPRSETTPRVSRLRSSLNFDQQDGSPPDGRIGDDVSSLGGHGDDDMGSPGLLGQMGEDGGRRTKGE